MKECGKYVRKYLQLENKGQKNIYPKPLRSLGKNGGNGRKYRWQYALCVESQYRWVLQEVIHCCYEILVGQNISTLILAMLVFFFVFQ